MKARIIKKLSKKLSDILPKKIADSWVDKHEVMEIAYEQGTRVSNCLMMGGELDYWGEGTDAYTVHEWFVDRIVWMLDLPLYPEGHDFENYPDHSSLKRLTGQYLLELARTIKAKTEQNNRVRPLRKSFSTRTQQDFRA